MRLKRFAIKCFIWVMSVIRIAYIIQSVMYGVLAIFTLLASIIYKFHPIELPERLMIFTNIGFGLLFLLVMGASIGIVIILTHFREKLRHEIE